MRSIYTHVVSLGSGWYVSEFSAKHMKVSFEITCSPYLAKRFTYSYAQVVAAALSKQGAEVVDHVSVTHQGD